MSIRYISAQFLRSYAQDAGVKLIAGHAHELVAAFFGYPTASALQAETEYPLEELDQAKFMVPDLTLMDQRRAQLAGLPAGLPTSDEMAAALADHLSAEGYFQGTAWVTRDLAEQVQIFIDENPLLIEDDLGGPMAETNAYFDELYVPEVSVAMYPDSMVAEASGSLNGTNDEDRAFHGDSIKFTSTLTFRRVAARTAFDDPNVETEGAVDRDEYYDEEPV